MAMLRERMSDEDMCAAYELIAEERKRNGYNAARAVAIDLLGFDPGLRGLADIISTVNARKTEANHAA